MANKSNSFELFRYQILPVDRFFQRDMFTDFSSIEDLLTNKNTIFKESLLSQNDFSNKRHYTVVKKQFDDGEFFLFKIAHNKIINRETKEFKNERIDNWPSILVALWNHPEKQLIAVQKRTTAFHNCRKVVELILEKLAPQLTHSNLRVIYEPLFEKQYFWDLLKLHQGKIKSVDFEFITPNMANISGCLSEDLKSFAKTTNSTRNNLRIESEPDSTLRLDKDNPTLESMVNYTGDGGGNITLKVGGIKKSIQTSRTVKEIVLSDIEMTGEANMIVNAMKELLK